MAKGTIRKRERSDGRPAYQVVLELDRDPITGKRQRMYKTVVGTKKEAQEELDEMKRSILGNNGTVVIPSAKKISDWMSEWLTLYTSPLSKTTLASYEERIKNKLVPYLGTIPMKALTTRKVQEWINELNKTLSPKSVKNVFDNLNAAMKKAVALRMLTYNPCDGVVLPKRQKPTIEVFSEQEIKDVLEVAKGKDIYFLIVLSISTGMRRGELTELKWSDVDFDNSIIHITRSKVLTAKGEKIIKAPKSKAGIRSISFGDGLKTILEAEKKDYDNRKLLMGADFVDSGYVLNKKNGEGFSPDSLTQKWVRFRNEHNLKDVCLHGFRHTSATTLLSAGVQGKVIQERLGHADISTTFNIYTHVLPSMNKDAGDKLDSKIFGDI